MPTLLVVCLRRTEEILFLLLTQLSDSGGHNRLSAPKLSAWSLADLNFHSLTALIPTHTHTARTPTHVLPTHTLPSFSQDRIRNCMKRVRDVETSTGATVSSGAAAAAASIEAAGDTRVTKLNKVRRLRCHTSNISDWQRLLRTFEQCPEVDAIHGRTSPSLATCFVSSCCPDPLCYTQHTLAHTHTHSHTPNTARKCLEWPRSNVHRHAVWRVSRRGKNTRWPIRQAGEHTSSTANLFVLARPCWQLSHEHTVHSRTRNATPFSSFFSTTKSHARQ